MPFAIALPTADRRVAHDFYRAAFDLEAVGEPAEDGVPEPLRFRLGADVELVLIPTGGFGWVTADHEVAPRGTSECLLNRIVGSPAEVDALTEQARAAGATVVVAPGDPGWGHQSTVADPDGHLWLIQVGW
ncbi:VOC family protein [Actinomycetospora straminea]|uniref:VOC family protein n=1 Tax=Actinomycetospora straminea TaxID=663607 RepID=A0ABP9E509_9PSEU|nr:VOC family protein [Actinomycetospora straminea]MDD7934604.1 VOC family protein [Actinomycetospora straminea]